MDRSVEASTGEGARDGTRQPEEIRRDIEQTRERLGETIEALAAKTDVKGQAKHRIEEAKRSPLPLAVAGAVVLGFLAWKLTRR